LDMWFLIYVADRQTHKQTDAVLHIITRAN